MKLPGKRWLIVAAVVLVVVVLAAFVFNRGDSTQYFTSPVERGDVRQVVEATGTINAVTSVQVGSQVSGTIASLFADFNSRVKKGQVIAKLDPSIYEGTLLQTKADLQNARASVVSARANASKAHATAGQTQSQYQRSKQLAAQGVISEQQLEVDRANADSATAAAQAADADIGQAEAQVAQKQAAVNVAQTNLNHTIITSPIDGTVVSRNVDVGQTVAASLQAPTLFVIAQDLTKMQVYAKTDEADVGRIQVGATASFRVDSFPRENFQGRVQQVRMNAATIQNVVTYDTIIGFDNPEQKLFPGMTAYVNIPVAWDNNVVKIPNGALRFRPDIADDERKALFAKYGLPEAPSASGRLGAAGASGGKGSRGSGVPGGNAGGGPPAGGSTRDDWGIVWKLLPNKTLQPMRVRLGVTDFTFTAMKEGELKPGDDLVISQASKNAPTQQPGGPQRAPTGGGPGGLPRRM